MSKSYNSKYYTDIFKWLLSKRLQNPNPEDPLLYNPSGIDLSTIFPRKTSRKSLSTQSKHNPFSPRPFLDASIPEITETKRNKARLYNENLRNKLILIKEKKKEVYSLKKTMFETQQKERESRFKRALEESKRKLSERIRTTSKKRAENKRKALENRLKMDETIGL